MSEWTGRERNLFLRALAEEGIEEIYVERAQTVTLKPESAPETAQAAGKAGSVKEQMLELRAQALQCVRCQELSSKRTHVVFGSGNIKADLMFVGEAPGADEDQQGLPFVGRAGQLLTKIIESIGLNRRQVFIANVLKCRPPGNRQPKPDEITNCNPFLVRQIELIRPKVICALGTFAAQTLLKTETSISRLRGRFQKMPGFDYPELRLMCTYHPAYLLRSPSEKRKVWEDMKMIRSALQES